MNIVDINTNYFKI